MAKVRDALQLEGTVWFAQPIASMSTIAREWAALHRTERVPVLRTILSGQVRKHMMNVTIHVREVLATLSLRTSMWAALHRAERGLVLRTTLSGQVHNQFVTVSEKPIDDCTVIPVLACGRRCTALSTSTSCAPSLVTGV